LGRGATGDERQRARGGVQGHSVHDAVAGLAKPVVKRLIKGGIMGYAAGRQATAGIGKFYKNDNATELRAARLGIEGNFLQGWKYKFETDFANSEVDVKDAYIEYSGEFVEPAYVRVGQYKTPNSPRS
jgi:Phosphate-selective porin O and P